MNQPEEIKLLPSFSVSEEICNELVNTNLIRPDKYYVFHEVVNRHISQTRTSNEATKELEVQNYLLRCRLAMWSGTFQKYQSFRANGETSVSTQAICDEYEILSRLNDNQTKELLEDKARLDWLESDDGALKYYLGNQDEIVLNKDIRTAISNAMKQEKS